MHSSATTIFIKCPLLYTDVILVLTFTSSWRKLLFDRKYISWWQWQPSLICFSPFTGFRNILTQAWQRQHLRFKLSNIEQSKAVLSSVEIPLKAMHMVGDLRKMEGKTIKSSFHHEANYHTHLYPAHNQINRYIFIVCRYLYYCNMITKTPNNNILPTIYSPHTCQQLRLIFMWAGGLCLFHMLIVTENSRWPLVQPEPHAQWHHPSHQC